MTYHSNRITLFSDIDKDRLSDFVESVFLLKQIFLLLKSKLYTLLYGDTMSCKHNVYKSKTYYKIYSTNTI